MHFAASTIGRVVTTRWATLAEEVTTDLHIEKMICAMQVKRNARETLLCFVTQRGHEVPTFVSSKAAKVCEMMI